MGIVEGMNGLRDIIPELDKRFRYTGSSSLEEKKPITLTHLSYNQIAETFC
jgi:hypothetical protein